MKRIKKATYFLLITVLMVGFMPSNVSGYGAGGWGCGATHDKLMLHGIDVLIDDWHTSAGNEADTYHADICIGLSMVDSINDPDSTYIGGRHFYNPDGHSGGAANAAVRNFNDAIDYYNGGDKASAYIYLGRALHFVQDLTVPHHANDASKTDLSNGHAYYEDFVGNRKSYFSSRKPDSGTYISTINSNYDKTGVKGFVDFAAHKSDAYWPYVNGGPWPATGMDSITNNYWYAFNHLIPLAIGLSAGFIYYFYQTANPPAPNPCPPLCYN